MKSINNSRFSDERSSSFWTCCRRVAAGFRAALDGMVMILVSRPPMDRLDLMPVHESRSKTMSQDTEQSEFVGAGQAAKMLGMHLDTLSRWRGLEPTPIPFQRIGRSNHCRYRKSDVNAFLASRDHRPNRVRGPRPATVAIIRRVVILTAAGKSINFAAGVVGIPCRRLHKIKENCKSVWDYEESLAREQVAAGLIAAVPRPDNETRAKSGRPRRCLPAAFCIPRSPKTWASQSARSNIGGVPSQEPGKRSTTGQWRPRLPCSGMPPEASWC